MEPNDDFLWQTKLHARLHDPAEKALVLLRDPAGHEGGTSRALHRDLGFQNLPVKDWLDPDNAEVLDTVLFKNGIPITLYRHVKRADWWAAGADRPQWPMQRIAVQGSEGETSKIVDWAQVRWTKDPILVHPLTGKPFDLKSLADTDIEDIKTRSLRHFEKLVRRDGETVDWTRTLLAFWRFGPELREDENSSKFGHLWPLLPADTRVPDHSIWDHLDLTSAFAGAFAVDPQGDAALLAVSLGPVQGFIAAARSTSDLWAGSHLLSRLAWEAMRVVCERLGPDAILFPRLRGVPQVDLWLRDTMKLPGDWFANCDWVDRNTDANPLFAAALPNRFVAVVPASQARDIAAEVTREVRSWLMARGETVIRRLLQEAEIADHPSLYCHEQLHRQLEGFPEVHWAAVPFSLLRIKDNDRDTLDSAQPEFSAAMGPYFGVEASEPCGFLASDAWMVLKDGILAEGDLAFFAPKPGVLYPAVYDLAERVLAAAKSVRAFGQTQEQGWRDSLSGEVEWLTDRANLLNVPPGKRRSRQDKGFKEGEHVETLWTKIADAKPGWAKKSEHLGAISAIKRLWPSLFAQEVAKGTGQDSGQALRFVVSTHTMTLAHQIDGWLNRGAPMSDELRAELAKVDPVPLPRKLSREHGWREEFRWAKRLPALLEVAVEGENEARQTRVERLIRSAFNRTVGKDEDVRLETYYALLLMDGDHMGKILSGDPRYAIPYQESFHPHVRTSFKERAAQNDRLRRYGEERRALSPGRHLAISGALNDFALRVVPEIVEVEHLGRVIYAGGDDVLAMLPVADALSAMRRLRCAYSGHDPTDAGKDWRSVRGAKTLVCKDGYAFLRGRLLRMMGEVATASCGLVIAHHQAPLAAVRRELHATEQRAKNEGGRNAFSISLIKRSGGATQFTANWGEPLDLLVAFRDFLREPGVSRRAVYNSLEWLRDLPNDATEEMLGDLLAYQLGRQTSKKTVLDHRDVPGLARRLAGQAKQQSQGWRDWMQGLLSTAEFLARETRGLESPSQIARENQVA